MANLPADLVALREGTGGEYHRLDVLMETAADEIEQLKLDLAQQALNGQTVMEQQKVIVRLQKVLADCAQIMDDQRLPNTAARIRDELAAPDVSGSNSAIEGKT